MAYNSFEIGTQFRSSYLSSKDKNTKQRKKKEIAGS